MGNFNFHFEQKILSLPYGTGEIKISKRIVEKQSTSEKKDGLCNKKLKLHTQLTEQDIFLIINSSSMG